MPRFLHASPDDAEPAIKAGDVIKVPLQSCKLVMQSSSTAGRGRSRPEYKKQVGRTSAQCPVVTSCPSVLRRLDVPCSL